VREGGEGRIHCSVVGYSGHPAVTPWGRVALGSRKLLLWWPYGGQVLECSLTSLVVCVDAEVVVCWK